MNQVKGSVYKDFNEIEQALENKAVTLHAKVKARISVLNSEGVTENKRVDTTPGRMMLWNLLPRHKDLDHKLINRPYYKERTLPVNRYCL
jgi:DNA-directed RNA polymerase subunit beta'